MYRLLEWRHGNDTAKFWFWSLTPLPCGFPYWWQYLDGLIMLAHPIPLRRLAFWEKWHPCDAYGNLGT